MELLRGVITKATRRASQRGSSGACYKRLEVGKPLYHLCRIDFGKRQALNSLPSRPHNDIPLKLYTLFNRPRKVVRPVIRRADSTLWGGQNSTPGVPSKARRIPVPGGSVLQSVGRRTTHASRTSSRKVVAANRSRRRVAPGSRGSRTIRRPAG